MMLFVSPVAFTLGAFTWSFAEYALHRFAGHASRAPRREGARRSLFDGDFGSEHQAHHTDTRYFTPTRHKMMAGAVAIGSVGTVASLLVGPRRGISYALGFGTMYAAYEIEHRRTHTHAPIGPYMRWTRKHHLSHHFTSPKTNHGVTSPIWDLVFGTYQKPDVIKVPRRHAPLWLLDPETDDVKPEYQRDYVLARPRATAPASDAVM